MRKLRALIPALLILVACSCRGPDPILVKAQRATYDAVAPDYLTYVDADPALSTEQRERRRRTVETWRLRVETQEEALKR